MGYTVYVDKNNAHTTETRIVHKRKREPRPVDLYDVISQVHPPTDGREGFRTNLIEGRREAFGRKRLVPENSGGHSGIQASQ